MVNERLIQMRGIRPRRQERSGLGHVGRRAVRSTVPHTARGFSVRILSGAASNPRQPALPTPDPRLWHAAALDNPRVPVSEDDDSPSRPDTQTPA